MIPIRFMPARTNALVVGMLALHGLDVAGQAASKNTIAVHPLGTIVASSPAVFTTISQIRPLADGRVLVNDPSKRQIVLLQPSLGNPVTVLDSAGGKDNSYGGSSGTVVPFRADSSIFVDRASAAFLVFDPAGKVARVMAGFSGALSVFVTTMGFSPTFGLVYRPGAPLIGNAKYGARPGLNDPEVSFKIEDSSFVVAMDPTTRAIDTVAWLAAGTHLIRMTAGSTSSSTVGLFPTSDGWTVASDGSIVLLHAQEYRVEWISGARTHLMGPKIPFDWKHMTDDDKAHVVDSVNADRNKAYADRLAKWVQDSTDVANGKAPAPAGGRGAGAPPVALNAGGGAAGISFDFSADGPAGHRPSAPPRPAAPSKADASDIPDYLPAVGSTNLLADADNNVWIRTRPPLVSIPASTPVVYDIVNHKGELIDRVQIPDGKTVIGFGPKGLVYLTARDAGTARLEMAHVK